MGGARSHPSLTLAPTRRVTLSFETDVIWRHRRADPFCAPPLLAVPGSAGRGRYVGALAQFAVEWQAARNLEVKGWISHFFVGQSVAAAGGADVRYVAASAAWTF